MCHRAVMHVLNLFARVSLNTHSCVFVPVCFCMGVCDLLAVRCIILSECGAWLISYL